MIKGDVIIQTTEDETVIIGKCEWDIRRDKGWRWCGEDRDDHVNFVTLLLFIMLDLMIMHMLS